MAKLTPNSTYIANNVLINEKIIPFGTRWTNAAAAAKNGYNVGDLYKKDKLLNNGTGKADFITAHNTNDIENVYDDGEQYSRATWPNQAMGTTRVHFYVDDVCGWQNLQAGTGMTPNDPKGCAEVGWHATDGSKAGGGNMTSIAVEIIMNDTPEHDAKAYDNGARLCAWLLWLNGLPIDRLVSHSYWHAKWAGKTNADIDRQCVTYVKGQHWCPYYIFNSNSEARAYQNWKKFKAVVAAYLNVLNGSTGAPSPAAQEQTETRWTAQIGAYKLLVHATARKDAAKVAGFPAELRLVDKLYKVVVGNYSVKASAQATRDKLISAGFSAAVTTLRGELVEVDTTIREGDLVQCNTGVKTYSNGATMPEWVRTAKLYVRRIEDDGKVYLVSTEPERNVFTGRLRAGDVHKV